MHVSEAIGSNQLALVQGRPGECFHAVGKYGVFSGDITAVIGAVLNVPV